MPLRLISRAFGHQTRGARLPVGQFLRRLIWLCMLPLVGLAAALGLEQIHDNMAAQELAARQRVQAAVATMDLKLKGRINGLEVLARSHNLDEPRSSQSFYDEAVALRLVIGSDVLLADLGGNILLHTGQASGSRMPQMTPPAQGLSAYAQVLATGKPAIGDLAQDKRWPQALVAVAAPVLRRPGTVAVLLTLLTPTAFERLLPAGDLPAGWALRVEDSQHQAVAQAGKPAAGELRTFTEASSLAPWHVVLSIPEADFQSPLRRGAWKLSLLLVAVTGIGVLGGTLASRRLTRAIVALSLRGGAPAAGEAIEELAAARRLLDESQEASVTAMAALDDSQRTFQALFDGLPDPVVFTSPTRDVRFINPAFTQLFGYTADEVVGRSTELLYADSADFERLGHERYNAEAPADAPPVEVQFRRKDGSTVWVESKGVCITGADGSVVGMIGVHRDISERKRQDDLRGQAAALLEAMVTERTAALAAANAELAERTRTITALYDDAPCGYLSLRPDGTITAANRTATTLLQRSGEALIGRSVVDFLTPACRLVHFEAVRAFQQAGNARGLKYEMLGPDDRVVPVRVDADFERATDGTVISARATLMDDSLRRARDQQIADMQLELARRAEQAEAANRAKSAFLANMSHEIRTPLNAILGLTHLLSRESTDARQRDRLAKVAGAGEHLLQVINDVLDLSKIEAGKMALRLADFDLDSLLAGVRAMVADTVRSKGLTLHLQLAPDLPRHWHGDATRLSQALLNLLSNAVKFTARGEVRVQVQVVDRYGAQRALLRFEVQDTGDGISPERQQTLFSAFEQADNSMTRRHGGTGLGLALTRHMAELMGGEVGVHSTAGQGSTFWFTAWLQTVQPPAQAAAPVLASNLATLAGEEPWHIVSGHAESLLLERHQGRSVLLAEDNPVNQEVASAMLEVVGLTVDVVGDGAQAVAAVLAGHYDLVLMDMQMPLMDGLTATRAIRASGVPGVDRLPIIAMTANAFSEDRQSCLAAGMDDHVAKPVHAEALYATLLRWLSRSA
jgi:PAS domain S-box-containing protein